MGRRREISGHRIRRHGRNRQSGFRAFGENDECVRRRQHEGICYRHSHRRCRQHVEIQQGSVPKSSIEVIVMVKRCVAACLLLFAALTPVFGQGSTGTLSGTVHDQQGGAIPGASVTVINESKAVTVATVVTNGSGDFVVPNLATGTYKLQVEMPQFKTLNLPGVVVTSGDRVSAGTLVIQIG